MPDYSKSKVYKLVCNLTGLVYVGSTVCPLYKRKWEHGCVAKRYQEEGGDYPYMTSVEVAKNGDFDIVLLEEVQCENKEQLHRKEREWIERLDCVNKHIPTRTSTEWHQINKERIATYHRNHYQLHHSDRIMKRRQYYQANREEVLAKQKTPYCCPCGSVVRRSDKAAHKKSLKHREWQERVSMEQEDKASIL